MAKLSEHKKAGYRNKKVSYKVLAKVLAEFLRIMDKKGDFYVPRECSELYIGTDISKRTFYNNFSCINDVLLASQKAFEAIILGDWEKNMDQDLREKMCPSIWYTGSNPVLAEFVLRRFTLKYFSEAFSPLKENMLKECSYERDTAQQEYIYRVFVAFYRDLLFISLRNSSELYLGSAFYKILKWRIVYSQKEAEAVASFLKRKNIEFS